MPSADGPPLSALVRDIRENGQHLPIVLYQGMVWDGRARLRVCTLLGIKPWLVPLRRRDPVELYIASNYDRMGEPQSTKRREIVESLSTADSAEGLIRAKAQRAKWIKDARAEFNDLIRDRREPCAVCGKHIDFVHAHHCFPLSLQFECGASEPIQDYEWLCPIHHKYVHVLLSGYLLGSRDLSFLESIPDHAVDEWHAIERSATKGIDLCCEALGKVHGKDKQGRYDPPYGLFLINHPNMLPAVTEWSRSVAQLQRAG
jgi:hypothetical protein